VPSECQILKIKCTNLLSAGGSGGHTDPVVGAYSAPQTSIAVLKGSNSRGRERKGERRRNGKDK